jgi:hypothetical protein
VWKVLTLIVALYCVGFTNLLFGVGASVWKHGIALSIGPEYVPFEDGGIIMFYKPCVFNKWQDDG